MRRGRGIGYALLAVAWLLLLVPVLALSAYLLAPPAWVAAVGLPPPTKALARVVVRLPSLSAPGQPGGGENAAWRRHRQPLPPASSTPALAVVLTGLGRSTALTAQALALPAAISLSFTPYGRPFEPPLEAVRAAGHEVLLELPLESAAQGALELGPQGLLAALPSEELAARLAWLLEGPPPGAEAPAVGVTLFGGDRFLAAAGSVELLVAELAGRGLLLLLNGPPSSLVAELARRDALALLVADREVGTAESALAAGLAEAERIALVEGSAVLLLRASPAVVAHLASWSAGVAPRGFTLVPLTAVLERRLAEAGP